MDVDSFLRIAERLGVPAAVLAALIIGIGWGLRMLLRPDTGLLTKLGDRHLKFIDHVEAQGDRAVTALEAQQNDAASLRQAFMHHADAMADVADGLGPATASRVRPRLEAMKRELARPV